jgi:hypothetical protein
MVGKNGLPIDWKRYLTLLSEDNALITVSVATQFLISQRLNVSNSSLPGLVSHFGSGWAALKLLVGYLRLNQHDPYALDAIPILMDPHQKGYQIKRLMSAFELQWNNSPEIPFLYIASLFSYPVPKSLLLEVIGFSCEKKNVSFFHKKNNYEVLVYPLSKCDVFSLSALLEKLADFGFVKFERDRVILNQDVQSYFQEIFKERFHFEWLMLHDHIFNHYHSELKKPLSEQQQFFLACKASIHGAKAGYYHQVLCEIYYKYLYPDIHGSSWLQPDESKYELNLYLLEVFFKEPWTTPIYSLSAKSQRRLLLWVGNSLYRVGNVKSAISVLYKAIPAEHDTQALLHASDVMGTLSKIFLRKKNYRKAIECGKQMTAYADLAGSLYRLLASLTYLINLQRYAGNIDEARRLLKKAKTIEEKIKQEKMQCRLSQ